jgi:cell division protein FtsB
VLPFHEVANLFPLLEGAEFEALKADIAEHGQREPVWTYQGKVIDGRNRCRACEALGVRPKTREWDGKGSLVSFVLSLNLHRRHLTGSQLATVAVALLPLLEAEAKDRQREGGKRAGRGRPEKGRQKLAEPVADGRAAQQAAQLVGTNRLYVTVARRLEAEAPDLFERVKAGDLAVMQARLELKRRERRQESEAAEAEYRAARAAGGDVWVTIPESWPSRNYDALRAQVLARPAFADRQAEVRRLRAEVERLRAEVERLEDEAYQTAMLAREADLDLQDAVAETIRAEHGPAVFPGERHYRISDPQALEEYRAIEDEDVRREWLQEWAGLCLHCGTRLEPVDDVPDDSWLRYLYCDWCIEHRGRTHCKDCGAPLQEGERGRCRECDPPPEPMTEEEMERARKFLEQFPGNLFADTGDGGGAKKPRGRKAKGG